MQLIEVLYKIVENPSYLQNYNNAQQYFQEKGEANIADAFAHLIEVRYANSPDIKQDKPN